jgi:hypothetical protein
MHRACGLVEQSDSALLAGALAGDACPAVGLVRPGHVVACAVALTVHLWHLMPPSAACCLPHRKVKTRSEHPKASLMHNMEMGAAPAKVKPRSKSLPAQERTPDAMAADMVARAAKKQRKVHAMFAGAVLDTSKRALCVQKLPMLKVSSPRSKSACRCQHIANRLV